MKTQFLKDYHIVKILGRGSFGNVTLVKRMSRDGLDGEEEMFAMKTVPQGDFSNYDRFGRNVEKEVFLSAVGHPYLIQLHFYFETKVLRSCFHAVLIMKPTFSMNM
jgi:serine/threonine protein kinase